MPRCAGCFEPFKEMDTYASREITLSGALCRVTLNSVPKERCVYSLRTDMSSRENALLIMEIFGGI